MSKLRPYLADIASAIREKKGTSEPINAKDFSAEIRSIESGGEQPLVEEKDVNFYDYDGTLLFSYTIEEAQALTELPTPKGHEGLVFDGWNWDYEDVIALDYPMDIGALYYTEDDITRLYLEIDNEKGEDVALSISVNGNFVSVDFGDGDGFIDFGSYSGRKTHHYAKGNYILSLKTKNVKFSIGSTDDLYNAIGLKRASVARCLKRVELSKYANLEKNAFNGTDIKTISVCKTTTFGSYTFGYSGITFVCCPPTMNNTWWSGGYFIDCKCISLPKTITTITSPAFKGCGFKRMCIPKSVTSLGAAAFEATRLEEFYCYGNVATANNLLQNTPSLKKVILNTTSLADGVFRNCFNLSHYELPSQLEELKGATFYQCEKLKELVFPKTFKSIAANAFYYAGITKYDFRALESIPTLANSSAFTNIIAYTKIIVPDALYDSWKAATNWSTYADYIIKASEYETQNG